jgi:hypothetical protein
MGILHISDGFPKHNVDRIGQQDYMRSIFLIMKESTEKTTQMRRMGVYVGMRAAHASPHIPPFLSASTFLQ